VRIKDDILRNLAEAQEADDHLAEVIKVAVQQVPTARRLPRPVRLRKSRAGWARSARVSPALAKSPPPGPHPPR
jgi:hypothetical protein